MSKYLYIFTLAVFYCNTLVSQNIVINGYIKDAQSGEALLFANCVDTISDIGTTTNAYGFFSLTIPAGKVVIKISYVGYKDIEKELFINNDTSITFELTPITSKLKEVVINGYTPVREQVLMGKTTVPVKTIKAIPSLTGEPDLMRAISFIPGVSTGKEGYSNIYVRGGDRGQNLILLDGMKLYNTNHIGGFLSLFNPNIIKHVDVYKGGFPARYGGRASSIIDIYTKDGNSKEFKGKFNIGLLDAGLTFEAPLNKKINYILATRTSYYDLYNISARREYNQTGTGEYFGYNFFDINGKVNWKISNKNRLSLSLFTGHDYQKTVDAVDYSAQKKNSVDRQIIHNTGISLIHNYILNSKIFVKNSFSYSNYSNKMETTLDMDNYGSIVSEKNTSFSKIDDYTLQSRFEISLTDKHFLRTGFEGSVYSFLPGQNTTFYNNVNSETTIDTTFGFISNFLSIEGNVYFEDEISITSKIKLNLGIRGTIYSCKDTTYYRAEPRVSFRWLMTDKFALKTNFTILNQYNHVIVNNVEGFEKEMWLSATKELPPQKAEQFSLGVFYGDDFNKFDISIEGFYKKMNNLLEYKSIDEDQESFDVINSVIAKNGIGKAYGFEFQLMKEFKMLSANINYTLSWSDRQFDELNNGKWYPFIYDRRHNLSLVVLWKINNKYSFSSNFVLSSGTPVTLPAGYSKTDRYVYNYYIYESINNRRLPLYHRLDIALIKKGKTKKGNDKQFSINIFNVYARQNPVYVYYDSNTGKVYQKSFFTIIPTISYSVNF